MAEGFTRPPALSGEQLFNEYFAARGIAPEKARRAGMTYVASARDVHPSFRDRPAIVIPYTNADGSPLRWNDGAVVRVFARVRYLSPEPIGTDGKRMRYRSPKGSSAEIFYAQGIDVIDWSAIVADPRQYVLIVEGEGKALCACLHGYPTLGIGGVSMGLGKDRRLLPELQSIAWEGRSVYIVFDSDVATNSDVLRARGHLAAELLKRKAVVHCVNLPAAPDGSKLGLDDYIKMFGVEKLDTLLDQTPPLDPGKGRIREGTDIEIADAVLIDLERSHASEVVFCEGQFHVYSGTHWKPIPDETLRNAVYGYDTLRFKPGGGGLIRLGKARTDSIVSVMCDRATRYDFFADAPKGINCQSGFVTLGEDGTAELEPHASDHRQRHCLPGSWRPGASWHAAPLLTRYLGGTFRDDADKAEKIALVSEMFGVAAMGTATALASPKAVVLHGMSAGNGKSELLEMMRGLLPEDAVCSVPPTKFADNAMLIELRGKRLNVCAELGTTHAIASDNFKCVVTGDQISARALYKSATFFKPVALNVFATNTLPPFAGGFDKGVRRRLLVLTFNRSIPEAEQVANIGGRIAAEEADQLLAFAVEGMERVAKSGCFSEPPSSAEALREWATNADPVAAWMASRVEFTLGRRVPIRHLYEDFKEFAVAEGFNVSNLPAPNNFVQRLLAHDARLAKHKNNAERSIVGLALRPLGARDGR